MNFTQLNGSNTAVDAKVIIDDFAQKKYMVYFFTRSGTKLHNYIDMLHDNGVSDDIMFNLKICYNLRGLDLTYISGSRAGGERKIRSTTELVERLDHKPCKIIVNSNKREELADVAQQLIYIGYPLTEVDIMLRSDAKDAAKTKRFMAKINDISNSIDTAIVNMDKLYSTWETMDIAKDEKETLLKTISETQKKCCSIKEEVEKAKSVEMTIAVAASKKTGKSVIVNSMIGEELAPTSLEMATPNTCVYKKSPDALYHLTYNGKRTNYNSPKELYNVINAEFKKAEQDVESRYRINDMVIEYVTEGNNFDTFTVFDTPGPGAAGTDHKVAAAEAIRKCDVAIFAIDYSKYLNSSEVEYLKETKEFFKGNQKYASLMFVINKLDLRYDDANSTKSTVKSIDFIRTRLKEIDKLYNDCMVFASSALQYYNAIHCEKMCKQFRTSENLTDLRLMAKHEIGAVRSELLMLDNIAGHYYIEHDFEKVTATDLKQHSGMPDLLNYAEYICKAKARKEIVNHIAVTIDTYSKDLKAIVDHIENIDRMIEQDEDQIRRIKDIIQAYNESVKRILVETISVDEVKLMEEQVANELINDEAGSEDGQKLLLQYFELFNKGEVTLDEIKQSVIKNITSKYTSDYIVYIDICNSMGRYTFDKLNAQIKERKERLGKKDVLGSVDVDEILSDVFSEKSLIKCTEEYIHRNIDECTEETLKHIEGIKIGLTRLINNRIESIKNESITCKKALEKLDIQLNIPEAPSFSFELPEYVPELPPNANINMKIEELDNFRSLFIKKGMNPLLQFFRNISNGSDVHSKDYYIQDIDDNSFVKEFKSIKSEISGTLHNSEIFNVFQEETNKLADRLGSLVERIRDDFNTVLSTLQDSASKFSSLVDDTELHRGNIEAHEREKELIGAISIGFEGFNEEWNDVLQDIDNKGEELI